ncbi:MAG: sulfatase-like hydrolase/transferase [Defluviitaleaceae bacterium]|nr:sulfatase-like hydrolase/transferase [Defluviitaleaceae bacterium]
MHSKPNILFIMCDQYRFDCIGALGNGKIFTPNIDRLVGRGAAFINAYSPCPVCVPARYVVHTGRDTHTTCSFDNMRPEAAGGMDAAMEGRCGPYLARHLGALGYRTFGVGKFHTYPRDEDLGFEVCLRTEEMWGSREERLSDAYCAFIASENPEYAHVEQPHGERTEMYYMPQTSPMPAELTVEAFAAGRAAELIGAGETRPWFGFVSFIGPHPPFAPPVPFNRMYNPDRMDNPVCGSAVTDHMDEHLPWMNRLIWADELNDFSARMAKARYYGEISYIDGCVGRLLDAVGRLPDPDNVLIAFFSDHGDLMGDHRSWQKESWFEQSARVPFLVSWPKKIPRGTVCGGLTALTDLFGVASAAAGGGELRDGADLFALLQNGAEPREFLLAAYGKPGTPAFKIMLRKGNYKYIFMSNGGFKQLFDLRNDPNELNNLADTQTDIVRGLHALAFLHAKKPGYAPALDDDDFKIFPFTRRPMRRINQMAHDLGANGFSFLQ